MQAEFFAALIVLTHSPPVENPLAHYEGELVEFYAVEIKSETPPTHLTPVLKIGLLLYAYHP